MWRAGDVALAPEDFHDLQFRIVKFHRGHSFAISTSRPPARRSRAGRPAAGVRLLRTFLLRRRRSPRRGDAQAGEFAACIAHGAQVERGGGKVKVFFHAQRLVEEGAHGLKAVVEPPIVHAQAVGLVGGDGDCAVLGKELIARIPVVGRVGVPRARRSRRAVLPNCPASFAQTPRGGGGAQGRLWPRFRRARRARPLRPSSST